MLLFTTVFMRDFFPRKRQDESIESSQRPTPLTDWTSCSSSLQGGEIASDPSWPWKRHETKKPSPFSEERRPRNPRRLAYPWFTGFSVGKAFVTSLFPPPLPPASMNSSASPIGKDSTGRDGRDGSNANASPPLPPPPPSPPPSPRYTEPEQTGSSHWLK